MEGKFECKHYKCSYKVHIDWPELEGVPANNTKWIIAVNGEYPKWLKDIRSHHIDTSRRLTGDISKIVPLSGHRWGEIDLGKYGKKRVSYGRQDIYIEGESLHKSRS